MNRKKLLQEIIEKEEKELFYDEINLAWFERVKEKKEKEPILLKGDGWQKELEQNAKEKEEIKQIIEGLKERIEKRREYVEFLKEKEKEIK